MGDIVNNIVLNVQRLRNEYNRGYWNVCFSQCLLYQAYLQAGETTAAATIIIKNKSNTTAKDTATTATAMELRNFSNKSDDLQA